MSYLDATATRLLATECICCGRALTDAVSVETAVGPICREKYGYHEVAGESRGAANALVYEAALSATSDARRREIAMAIRTLGFVRLSTKIIERFRGEPVEVLETTNNVDGVDVPALLVKTPYGEGTSAFNTDLKATIGLNDRKPRVEEGRFVGWVVRPSARRALFMVLIRHFGGSLLVSAKGESVLPQVAVDTVNRNG